MIIKEDPKCLLGSDKYRSKCNYCNSDKGKFFCAITGDLLAIPLKDTQGNIDAQYVMISHSACKLRKYEKKKKELSLRR